MKRVLIVGLVIVLALGGLGMMTAAASEVVPGSSSRQQDEGRAWLGVGIADSQNGVTITSVEPASPADEAQLYIGDIITAVDATPVDSAEDVVERVGALAPGDVVTLTVERRGTERDIDVTLGSWPEEDVTVEPSAPEFSMPMFQGRLDFLGLQASITDEGLQIDSIDSDSPLAGTDLQAGDVITAINGESVIDAARPGVLLNLLSEDPLVLTVLRDGAEIEITIDVNLLEDLSGAMPEWEEMVPGWEEMMPGWDNMPGYGPMMGMGNMLLSFLGVDLSVTGEGLQIGAVEAGSPAAEAGLQEGDVITAINGVAFADLDMWEMMKALGDSEGQVTLTVLRDGEEMALELDLSDLPAQFGLDVMPAVAQPTRLGVRYLTLDADLAAERDLAVEEGALIEEVYADTPAEEAGLQVGDVVTAVDGDPVDARRTLSERLSAYDEGDQVTLTVVRAGEELSLGVTLGPGGWARFGLGNMPGWSGRGPRFHDMMPHGGMFGGTIEVPNMPGWSGRGPRFREMMPHGGMFGGTIEIPNMPGLRFHMGPHMGDLDFEEFFENFPLDDMPFHWGWGDAVPETGTEAVPDGQSA